LTETLANPSDAVMDLSKAIEWRAELRKFNKKLVVTNGCFDILHRGHVEYLRNARLCGDCLLVLLNSDASVKTLKGPDRPLNSEGDRAFVLTSLRCVDAALIFGSPRCTDMIKSLKPDIYVKGGDYNIDTINGEEKAALLEIGTQIEFIPFVPGFSTTNIIDKIKN
jgi:rfaE bifunctional protein nucleotidyltransferase chain/domain